MKTCYQCFEKYESEKNICPYCGYKENMSVDVSHLVTGTILQNRYLIGKVLGAGGFGVTYAAWDQVLEHRVAIKEYIPGEFSTRSPGQTQITIYSGEKAEQFQAGKEKFLEESKRLAGLKNISGIVQIFDCFHENETVYIVMEYLDGETLESRLKRQNKLAEREAVEIISSVLLALKSVHKEGILHRDIAPNNIFLCKTGEVKLLDFGAARSVTGSHSKSLTVLYKEGYTAEEQYRSRGEQGTWTDVYACAATLYRMITGIVPPIALERRVKDRLKAPSQCAHISCQTNKAILNALNVDRSYRTQSAEVFLEELTGKKKVKNRFVRTVERRIGTIPVGVRIALGMALGAVSIGSILLFTGVIQFEAGSFGDLLLEEGKVRVPNIINLEVNEAQEKIQAKSLSIQVVDKQFSDSIPKDRILSQSIKAGKVTEQDTVIEVVVSGGEKTQANGYELEDNEMFVLDFQYKDLTELKDVDILVELVFENSDMVEGGKVIKQSLEAGEVIEKDEEMLLLVSSPDFISRSYEYMVAGNYSALLDVEEEISDYMQSNEIGSLFFCPENGEANVESGEGLFLYFNGDVLNYYLGEHVDGKTNGHGIWSMKCNCGADEPYFVYEGEWNNGTAQGYGTVYSHWSNGEKYQISGQFDEGYAEGTLQMQWEQEGSTFHGQFSCIEHIIQPVEAGRYGQFFQAEPNQYFYTFSQERDEWGIPWAGLTTEEGYGISLGGLVEVN